MPGVVIGGTGYLIGEAEVGSGAAPSATLGDTLSTDTAVYAGTLGAEVSTSTYGGTTLGAATSTATYPP